MGAMSLNLVKYTDKELLELLNNSNKATCESAFAEIYSRYSSRLYSYCLKVMINSDDANDVFQETLIKFYNMRNQIDRNSNLIGFLLKMSRNICLNHKRTLKNYESIEDNQMIAFDESMEDKELVEIIAKALEKLEFEQREIFVLRQYHGLSFSEIAEITHETVGTLRMRYLRAKEKLRKILSPYFTEISKWEIQDDILN